MIIILEGPDGSGKSTLGKSLSLRTGWDYAHSGKPKDVREMGNTLFELEEKAKSHKTYIIDRTPWFSELVYANAFGNDLMLPVSTLYEYWRLPQKVIFCLPTILEPAMIGRESKPYKNAEFLEGVVRRQNIIAQMYRRLFEDPEVEHFIRYDFQNPDHMAKLNKFLGI